MSASILPSPEDAAREFVQKQPKNVKRKLERSVMAAYGEASAFWNNGFDSDSDDDEKNAVAADSEGEEDGMTYSHQSTSRRTSASSTQVRQPIPIPHAHKRDKSRGEVVEEQVDEEGSSDDDGDDIELGTGTALALPGFIASFIKGIGDRFQLHVGQVKMSIQMPKNQAFPHLSTAPTACSPVGTDEKMVIIEFQIAGVSIEGVTVTSAEVDISAFAHSGSGQIKVGKKKIQLNKLNAFMIGDEGWFDESKPDATYQTMETGSGEYDGTDSPYGHMQESVCTVKDVGASVATLKAESDTPRPSTPNSPFLPSATVPVTATLFRAPSSISDDDDMFESLYDSMAEEENDKLAASVVSLGSLSDTGTAQTSQEDHLTESQMFADPDSDSEGEVGPRYGTDKIYSNNEELPFAMASYIATEAGVAGSPLPEIVQRNNQVPNTTLQASTTLPPLPLSPTDPSSSQASSPSTSMALRPISPSSLPATRNNSLSKSSLPNPTPALFPTPNSVEILSHYSQHSSIHSHPPMPSENVSREHKLPLTPAKQHSQHGSLHQKDILSTSRGSRRSNPFPESGSQSTSSDATSEAEWEDDEAARQKLCESMFFSHEDAGSLYLSAMSGVKSSVQGPLYTGSGAVGSDGARDIDNLMGGSTRPGTRKGELEGEELTEQELEERLDRLIGSTSHRGSENASPLMTPARRMRKKIAEIDYVEVWVPALNKPSSPQPVPSPELVVGSPARGMEDTQHQHLPGSFSMYGASPPLKQSSRIISTSPRPVTPKGASGGVKFADGVHSSSHSPSYRAEKHPVMHREKDAEVEVFVGKVEMKTDLIVGGLLAKVFALLGVLNINSEVDEEHEKPAEASKEDEGSSKKKVEVVVGELDCRLVEKLFGELLPDNGQSEQKLTEANNDGQTILDINLQHTRTAVSTLIPKSTSSMAGDIITTTRVSVGNMEIRDTKGPFIQFVSKPSACLEVSPHTHQGKKRTSSVEQGVAMQSDVKLTITTAGRGTRIDVQTLPLHVQCQLGRIEELLGWFGGFGRVLGLSSTGPSGFNTPTPTTFKQAKGVTWKEEGVKTPQKSPPSPGPPMRDPELKIDANIGGLIVDVEGEEGALGLRTSVIKIRKRNEHATVIGIEKIIMLGPHLVERVHESDARIIVDNTRMEFSSKPNDEDLARLLKLLTPSKDKFAPDDDILLDTLFEQRRQGSVLRISMARVSAEVDNLRECEKFQGLGDELAKVLTVTNYIPQDERPGLLTLFYVGGIEVGFDFGEMVGKIKASVREVELSHVSVPSLVALAMGTIGVRRNGHEELIGEGLPKEIAIRGFANHVAAGTRKITDYEDRPMVMVRMVGDDPEPVIKVKLWNLKIEYNVDTLMALMNSPGATADGIARDMVDSIATLTEKQVMREQKGQKKKHMNSPLGTTMVASRDATTSIKSLRVEIVVRDSILGLNPLILPSRGLVILTDSKFYLEMPSPKAELEMNVEIKRASVALIDDISNLRTTEEAIHEAKHRRRKDAPTEHIAAFAELGYVSIASISSARAVLKLVESEVPGDKCIDLEVWDDLFIMETCADSTQTLLGVINGLKPPLPEGEEVKYCTEVMPLDMFASMIEDSFAPGRRHSQGGDAILGGADTAGDMLPDIQAIGEDGDGDLVSDDVPMNLAFVESYYGKPNVNYNYSQEALADDMLEDDLTHIAKPSRPLRMGERGELKTFEEQVQMLDDTPLEILDNHFSVIPRASLIEMAAKSAIGAPVRVKVRDVHVIWNLHDGYDWARTRDTISKAVKKVEGRAIQRRTTESRITYDPDDDDPESVIEDLLFNSIYIGIPANRDPRELSRQINQNLDAADMMSETGSYASTGLESRPGSRSRRDTDPRTRGLRLSRSRTHKLQIELKGVCVDFILFPQNGGETQSSVDLKVRDLEIIDNVPTSTWKKFVTYMRDAGKRETGSQMAHIEILNVKPVPTLAASELVIKVSVHILRAESNKLT